MIDRPDMREMHRTQFEWMKRNSGKIWLALIPALVFMFALQWERTRPEREANIKARERHHTYEREREVFRICPGGIKVWRWRGNYYIENMLQVHPEVC